MKHTFLKCKIHRATVTEADLNYEGSITLDRDLCKVVGLREFEQVDVYNITNGKRFTTYALYGKPGQICVNGAAARLVQKGDLVIVAAYLDLDPSEIDNHEIKIALVDGKNILKDTLHHRVREA